MSELSLIEDDAPEEIDGTQDQEIESLGSRLSHVFTEYKESRKETENEWLKDLRQFQGMYEPDVLARLNESGARSKVFVGLSRTKVMAAYSRIVDLLWNRAHPNTSDRSAQSHADARDGSPANYCCQRYEPRAK